jgi:cytoskeletal protein CcmA (bactofilin family)
MALWKDAEKETPMSAPKTPVTPAFKDERPPPAPAPVAHEPPRPATRPQEVKESVIAAGLAIEGKIEGGGHVRIAGRFNGDVHVEGNLTIEPGAKLTGEVRAKTVIVGGELEGNIDAAQSVELTSTGVLTGDLKAGSLTVSAGSRMRGKVEFGWDDKGGRTATSVPKKSDGFAS